MINVVKDDATSHVYQPARMIFCDPPQMVGKNSWHDLTKDAYEVFTINWLENIFSFLKDPGVLVLLACPSLLPTFTNILYPTHLHFLSQIIWHFRFGSYRSHSWSFCHYNILVYSNRTERDIKLNEEHIRIPSQRQRDGDKRADPRGRVPSSVWEFPRLPGNDGGRISKVPQLPYALCERLVRAYTNEDDLVLDPFCGSGVMTLACKLNKRRCIATDVESSAIELTNYTLSQEYVYREITEQKHVFVSESKGRGNLHQEEGKYRQCALLREASARDEDCFPRPGES